MKLATLLIAVALSSCQSSAIQPDAAAAKPLRLATWNMGTIVAPEGLAALKESCQPKGVVPKVGQRAVACDVLDKINRGDADFAALARYAQALDADVLALEEVDGASAARHVLTGYEYCFASSPRVQNVGFAIREGIPYRCAGDLKEVSLQDTLPRGAQVVIYPNEVREMHLLAVHLQYGCGRAPLSEAREACETLARQIPAVKGWIDQQASMGHAFALFGGFNRDFETDTGPARDATGRLIGFWAEISRADRPGSELVNTVSGHPYIGCTPEQNYPGYFDQVVLSQSLAKRRRSNDIVRVTFDANEAKVLKLSNQCPVGIDLDLGDWPGSFVP